MDESKSLLRNRRSVYSLSSLTRKAVVTPDIAADVGGLKKCLTAVDLIAYGVGSTVGAGIFVTIGVVAKNQAGPAVLLSFLIAAFACLISAFCYAEFAARIPVSGSAYTFSYVALGEFLGWFIGWNLTLEYSISASAVARGWANYMQSFFHLAFDIDLPAWLVSLSLPAHIYGDALNKYINLSPLSVVIIFLCTCILLMGVKDSAKFNLTITIINVTTIVFVVVVGAMHVDMSNWSPFFPMGWNGAFAGAGTVFFSYIGFDSVTTLAAEVSRPSRDLPLGIVGTLGIATALYVGVSLVVTGMVNYTVIDVNAPLTTAFEYIHLRWAAIIVSVGGVTALVASTLCSLLGQPRIYYQMAKDGLIPPQFGTIDAKTQAPVFGTIVTGVSASILAVLLDLSTLADMISIGTLLAFTVVCGGIVVMRCREPEGAVFQLAAPSAIANIPVPLLLFVYFLDSVLISFGAKYHWPWWSLLIILVPLLVVGTILVLRPQPNRPTTFQCPFVPILPLVGVLVNTFLIIQLNIDSIIRVLVWTAIGMAIYFGYGIRHSRLNLEDPSESKSSSGSLNGSPGNYKYVKVDAY